MPLLPGGAIDRRVRSRAVFIHAQGHRLFLDHDAGFDGREVTASEVEALVSAGFEIVQVNMREGAPLCATLAAHPADSLGTDPARWASGIPRTHLDP